LPMRFLAIRHRRAVDIQCTALTAADISGVSCMLEVVPAVAVGAASPPTPPSGVIWPNPSTIRLGAWSSRPAQPGVQTLPRTPNRCSYLGYRPSLTDHYQQARYRCSATQLPHMGVSRTN
jgi:hypothetical protein